MRQVVSLVVMLVSTSMFACRSDTEKTKPGGAPSPSSSAVSAVAIPPEAVCRRTIDFIAQGADPRPSDEARAHDVEACAPDVAKMRDERPKEYACYAPCVIAANNIGGLKRCSERCKDAR